MIHVVNGDNLDINTIKLGDYIVGRFGDPCKVVDLMKGTAQLECLEHGSFTVSNNRIGKKCPKCPRTATRKNFIAKSYAVYGRVHDYHKVKYVDSKTKVTITCKLHGPFEQEPRTHLSGKGCPKCGRIRQKEAVRLDEVGVENKKLRLKQRREKERAVAWKALHKKLKRVGANSYLPLPVSNGRFRSFNEVQVTCNEHNEVFKANTRGILNGIVYCPVCIAKAEKLKAIRKALVRQANARKRKLRRKQASVLRKENQEKRLQARAKAFLRKIKLKHPTIDYSDFVYKDMEVSKGLARCHLHGDFYATPGRHVRSKNPCPECESDNLSKVTTKSTRHFIELSKAMHGDKYDYSKAVYVGKKYPVTVICKKHGEFSVVAGNHMHNKTNYGGCPKCRTTRAKRFGGEAESKVARFIERLGFEVKIKDRKIIKPYEIDVLVPEKDFGVEIHGEYWHSSRFKEKNYHSMKARRAEEAGIVLYQFWYREILKSPKIVRSMIRSALGESHVIYARKTKIRRVQPEERRLFFSENHLQGDARASIAYGLYENGILVACMSFGKPRFNKKYEWEVIRFANKLNRTVVGGASKLWKHFLKEQSPNNVLTYADRRYSTGNLYKTLGFKMTGSTAPNYFWHNKSGETLTRYETQKHKLHKVLGDEFKEDLSEVQNMERTHSYRVYDAGNYRLSWKSK